MEESSVMAQIESSIAARGMHKRIYSAAFSQTPHAGRSSTGLSPVSKLIKEQQLDQDDHSFTPLSRATTPAELENSLRRLSVAGDPSHKTDLFHDTPIKDQALVAIPLHEVTLQASRLLSLPSSSHLIVAKMFPDGLLQQLMSASAAISRVVDVIFQPRNGHLVLSTPSLRSALQGADRLIEELDEISSELKKNFKDLVTYLERHPEEATARRRLALSFCQRK